MSTTDRETGKSKGFGPWRQDWYSICSRHRWHMEGCRLCAVGQWRNRWAHIAGSVLFKLAPGIWIWWANRPRSGARKFMEKVFPGSRKKRS
jgi:hypothetical protein